MLSLGNESYQERNPREDRDGSLASVANDGEEKGSPRTPRRDLDQSMVIGAGEEEKAGSDHESGEHDSPKASPRTPGTPVASSNDDTPNPNTGEVLTRGTLLKQAKAAPANSPWWASYPLTIILLLASFGAGLNFMLSCMNGRYNNLAADKFVPTLINDTDFKVFGDVTNLMVLGTSILAKAGLDYAYNHNPLSSIGSSIINTGKGATLGALSAFGYKQATNENLPRAEAMVSHVTNLAEQTFGRMGNGSGRGGI